MKKAVCLTALSGFFVFVFFLSFLSASSSPDLNGQYNDIEEDQRSKNDHQRVFPGRKGGKGGLNSFKESGSGGSRPGDGFYGIGDRGGLFCHDHRGFPQKGMKRAENGQIYVVKTMKLVDEEEAAEVRNRQEELKKKRREKRKQAKKNESAGK